ncbi:DUF6176 family protein [Arthrobacter sp. zg-Y238]|uniref:DUF6176 family protein n=1 Tax=Arthrobacter sp. zg-Y238 TaxID=2964614 RepID=UPI0021031B26|nr:DUF6176 family protein [Arthrobacter sp. zg-Y238]MCQ1952889.1 DUF6176 family protein [Arthrobacter sp. zg-Y238]
MTPSAHPPIPFEPAARDFPGWTMPPSVPQGMRMELSRARLLDSRESSFDDWMTMLHERYDECLATLGRELMALEATFLNQEADGSWWMYHFQLMGNDSPGLVPDNPLDQAHLEYGKKTKHPGWEELQPRFFLCPPAVRAAVEDAGAAGAVGAAGAAVASGVAGAAGASGD